MNKPSRYGRQPINDRQKTRLHTLANTLGWDKDTYRSMLAEQTGKESSLDLTWRQAEDVIEDWEKKAIAAGVWKRRGGVTPPGKGQKAKGKREPQGQGNPAPTLKYTDLDGRPGYANGAQCRLIDAMWSQVSRAEDEEAREKALGKFLKRIVRVDALRFLKVFQVEKVVKALESMGAQKK